MKSIWANKALLPHGWATNVRVIIDDAGKINSATTLGSDERPRAGDQQIGILLPSPANVHSHAFQRAMAGLTERRGPNPKDSFWTWRQLMFHFLDQLTPDDVEGITAYVQMEMLEAGYATNVEFHYLHHQPGGAHYDNLAEMAHRVAAAASQTGIGLTLLPVHYQFGGCDQRPLGPGQIRFGTDLERYEHLWHGSNAAIGYLPEDTAIGVAPHSLRAISNKALPDLLKIAPNKPFHMHLAEQTAEVQEVKQAWGKRPVEWLLDNAAVDRNWCLIHCTQMLAHETQGLAETGAVAGLCPITESSLGDGIFDGIRWMDAGGNIAIGSDSNIRISLAEEMRTLDYSQRLRDNSRAALATSDKSTGRRIFDAICQGGAQAAGRNCGSITEGAWADMFSLDDTNVDLIGHSGDTILDAYIFAGDDYMVKDVWSAGRKMVSDHRHIERSAITDRYAKIMKKLRQKL